jgi:hypothetical protein
MKDMEDEGLCMFMEERNPLIKGDPIPNEVEVLAVEDMPLAEAAEAFPPAPKEEKEVRLEEEEGEETEDDPNADKRGIDTRLGVWVVA